MSKLVDRAPGGLQEDLGTDPATSWSRAVQVVRPAIDYATRLSAGDVADEWVTQILRQTDAKVFRKYSQMKREALARLDRQAGDRAGFDTEDDE